MVALSVTLGLFAIELVGFLCGVSMFNNNQALLCILTSSTSSPRAQQVDVMKEQSRFSCPLEMDIFTFIILEQSKN